MVTTHLRTRAAQAGALLAVVVGGVFAAPAVAFASPPNVQISDLQTEVLSGGRVDLRYIVADTNDNGGAPTGMDVRVTGMGCSGDCKRFTQVDNEGREFSARLTAPNVNAGETRQVTITITATTAAQPGRQAETGTTTQQITVKGPDKPQAVRQVSGRVKDQDGKALAGAVVGLRDSAGSIFSSTSDGSGAYSFTSSDNKPITPGTISIGAGKDGFEEAAVQRQASAGQSVVVALTLKSKAAPSASASATPSATASAAPTTDVSVEAPPEQTVAADPNPDNAANTEDSGGSMLYIIIGILLVAAGLGAIVLVVLRRRNSDDGDDDSGSLAGPGGVVPPTQGRFNDATRVGAPMGGARGNDATMVAPRSGAPSMADAPTMIQRVPAAEDEFPDPYGVPMPQPGGFAGAAAGGWNDQGANNQYGGGTQQYGGGTQQYGGGAPQQQQPYGESTQYGGPQPGDDNGYGQQGGGYGAYSEATGMYRPEAGQPDDGGYGGYDQGQQQQPYGGDQQQPYGGGYQGGGGYGQQQPDQGGYGSWDAPGNGIDNNGYGPQGGQQYGGAAPQGGQYGGGAPQQQQYGGGGQYGGGAPQGGQQYGGYDEGGYQQQGQDDQRGGYDAYQGGGYGDQAGAAGYDDQQQYGNQGGRDQRGGGGTYGGQPRQDVPPAPRRGGQDY